MRAFLAFTLASETKEKIANIISSLSALPAKIKWVENNNLHLTVRFFPKINQTVVELLEEKLKTKLSQIPKIKVEATEICLLRHGKDIRLIYLKLKENSFLLKTMEKIKHLASDIIPNKEEKKPLLHITLGRIKHVYNKKALEETIENYKFKSWEWYMEEVVLFQSILKPSGPLYQPLFKIKLSGITKH